MCPVSVPLISHRDYKPFKGWAVRDIIKLGIEPRSIISHTAFLPVLLLIHNIIVFELK